MCVCVSMACVQFQCCKVVLFVVLVLIGAVTSQWAVEDDGCRTPDRGAGECIAIKDCKFVMDFILNSPTPLPWSVAQRLRQYQCGFEGNSVKVCCPPAPLMKNPPDVSGHRNLNLLPTACGYIDSSNRIINGDKTGLFEFPWMALISIRTRNGLDFGCGGTILNNKYILTAAHCISDYILKPRGSSVAGVRVGEHNINTPTDCETIRNVTTCAPPFQDFRIEKLIPHEEYNPSVNLNNDIGLIRVAGTIDLSLENMKPVCLPIGTARNYDFSENNSKGVVTGWGATESRRNSPDLLKVSLEMVSLEQCQKLYKSKNVTSPITYKHYCAGGKNNKDSCAGDSGGPLHAPIPDEETGDVKYFQQGIVSFGPTNCGATGFPGIYTKVSYFMDWILNNIKP